MKLRDCGCTSLPRPAGCLVLANQRRSRLRRHARGTCVLSASSQHSTTDIQASKVKVPLTAFGQDSSSLRPARVNGSSGNGSSKGNSPTNGHSASTHSASSSSSSPIGPARSSFVDQQQPQGQHQQQQEEQQERQQDQQQQERPPSRPSSPIQDLLLKTLEGETDESTGGSKAGAVAAALSMLGGIGLLLGGGYVFREPIKHFLNFFIGAVDEWGALGYLAYALVYTALEVLAVPAIPLTMTAGVIFGPVPGTVIVSASATVAATIAFLIAKYAVRDKIMEFAWRNKRFAAVDRAISQDGFKFVLLLRLSPLLPLAASNYLYGLTSVDLGSYVLGSWLGMLPGTYAYVTAGHVGKAILVEGQAGAVSVAPWQVLLGLGASLLAIGFIGQLAKKAVEEADEEAQEQERRKARGQAQVQSQVQAQAGEAAAGQLREGEVKLPREVGGQLRQQVKVKLPPEWGEGQQEECDSE